MAAGLGFKDFVTGEVLTAADVDGYLMQGVWVFASAAARDAAVTSPQEGNFAYLKDTNVTTYYTGSAWANLDTTGMTNPMTTTGDTIYSSSGSTPARLGIGSTGNVLTVAGGVPTWAAPASGGGLTLISETVASASSAIDFTSISGSYKQLLLVWAGVKHSGSGSSFGLRLNADSGANYECQGMFAVSSGFGVETAERTSIFNGGADYMPFGQNANSAAVHTQPAGYILIDNYSSSTKAKTFYGQWCYYDGTNNRVTPGITGYYNSATAITQVNIFRNTGSDTLTNNTNTTIRLYGIS
jgi:hypothetical protein